MAETTDCASVAVESRGMNSTTVNDQLAAVGLCKACNAGEAFNGAFSYPHMLAAAFCCTHMSIEKLVGYYNAGEKHGFHSARVGINSTVASVKAWAAKYHTHGAQSLAYFMAGYRAGKALGRSYRQPEPKKPAKMAPVAAFTLEIRQAA